MHHILRAYHSGCGPERTFLEQEQKPILWFWIREQNPTETRKFPLFLEMCSFLNVLILENKTKTFSETAKPRYGDEKCSVDVTQQIFWAH